MLSNAANDSDHYRTLGLSPGASMEEVLSAHARLTADLTPGSGADHSRVSLALSMLEEVDHALAQLRTKNHQLTQPVAQSAPHSAA